MEDILQASQAPENMRIAFLQLQQLYGQEHTPLILGTEEHGGATDGNRIEVGIDQMMLCILANYHKVPAKYRDSSPFFVLGHEFGHIVAHPGKDSIYWTEGAKELPVEAYQRFRWMNCVSDILVNWTVITGTAVLQEIQKDSVKRQMLDGWQAGQFIRRCGSQEGFNAHDRMLKDKKLNNNRYTPIGGLPGQYDDSAFVNLSISSPDDKYIPTALTPFYQKHTGHGRGEQYYPPINYCVAENMGDNWKKVKMLKTDGSLKKGSRYTVESTRTFDGRIDSPTFEPIKEYKINGQWTSARYCQSACPQCGNVAISIWDNWWKYRPKAETEAEIAQEGTYRYLLIQMFAFEWAMAYSTLIPYGNNPKVKATGEKFLEDIAEEMNNVMRCK